MIRTKICFYQLASMPVFGNTGFAFPTPDNRAHSRLIPLLFGWTRCGWRTTHTHTLKSIDIRDGCHVWALRPSTLCFYCLVCYAIRWQSVRACVCVRHTWSRRVSRTSNVYYYNSAFVRCMRAGSWLPLVVRVCVFLLWYWFFWIFICTGDLCNCCSSACLCWPATTQKKTRI